LEHHEINGDIGNTKQAFRYMPKLKRDIYCPRNKTGSYSWDKNIFYASEVKWKIVRKKKTP
jgi:hypothetical protein